MKLTLRLFFLSLLSLSSFASLDRESCSAEDRSVFSNNANFISAWRSCGELHWGNGRPTTDCILQKFPALSRPCGNCFGAFTSCAKNYCESRCFFNSASQACKQCGLDNCGNAWSECTGASLDSISSESQSTQCPSGMN